MAEQAIYTVGHSTRALDEFLGLLQAQGVRQIADIRMVPRSRRHPHFSMDALSASLRRAGVVYRHFPALGGLRKPRRDSQNSGWRHPGFRGYADYMETSEFRSAIEELVRFGLRGRTAVMCAERVWWRCHRQLVADALVARGVEVKHVVSDAPASPHRLTEFARLVDDRVTYPGLPV